MYVDTVVAPPEKEDEMYELPQQFNGRPLPNAPKKKK
jgi:hypothetical protein